MSGIEFCFEVKNRIQFSTQIKTMENTEEVVSILAKSIPFRKDFQLAIKESRESPEEWLIRVKFLAKSCGFDKSYNLFVLDKFLTGLEAEIIDHLCSSAEYLDIDSSLEIIKANKELTTNIKEETMIVEPADVLDEPETVRKPISIVQNK